jgi:toxin ParE1/3/4
VSGGYLLTPLALADISDIWDYSYSNWGANQADTYVLAIHTACEELAQTSAKGRPGGQSAEHIRAGYRKYLVGSHVIFFRCQACDSVEVVRVLNQRMDEPAHL